MPGDRRRSSHVSLTVSHEQTEPERLFSLVFQGHSGGHQSMGNAGVVIGEPDSGHGMAARAAIATRALDSIEQLDGRREGSVLVQDPDRAQRDVCVRSQVCGFEVEQVANSSRAALRIHSCGAWRAVAPKPHHALP